MQVIVLISERMQRPPKPNWWSPTPFPHRGLAAHAQEPPPHSPWCTTWGPGVNPSAFQLWQLLNTTAKATFRRFPRLLNCAPPRQLTPRPALHRNLVLGTWPAWGPLLLWSLRKQRPFRLYKRDLNTRRTMKTSRCKNQLKISFTEESLCPNAQFTSTKSVEQLAVQTRQSSTLHQKRETL